MVNCALWVGISQDLIELVGPGPGIKEEGKSPVEGRCCLSCLEIQGLWGQPWLWWKRRRCQMFGWAPVIESCH
jgi:hypothetical protein